MNVNDAVGRAKLWVSQVLREEQPTNIGLEEVEFDGEKRVWLITIGFSRPWNSTKSTFTSISGEPSIRRTFRIISVRDSDGQVLSMKKRDDE